MEHRSRILLIASLVLLYASVSLAAEPFWSSSEATRSRITVVDVDGSKPKVIFDSPQRYGAPEWTPDGTSVVFNAGGKLWRLPASGGTLTPIPTGSAR